MKCSLTVVVWGKIKEDLWKKTSLRRKEISEKYSVLARS